MNKGVEYIGKVVKLGFPNKGEVDCGEDGVATVKGTLPGQEVKFVVSKKRAGKCVGRLKEIISEQLEVDADSVTPETKLGEDLNADSLDIVEMLMALEDEFGVDIPDEEIEKMKTVGDVVNYIQENKN